MFHDDDAVPDIDSKSAAQVLKEAKEDGGMSSVLVIGGVATAETSTRGISSTLVPL